MTYKSDYKLDRLCSHAINDGFAIVITFEDTGNRICIIYAMRWNILLLFTMKEDIIL